ncbi:MAG: hypothetical protein IT379_07725 [Deltaproteobacteria bacterium]|nr:hypothetical protein [Deltaproteobacteria bacterium]
MRCVRGFFACLGVPLCVLGTACGDFDLDLDLDDLCLDFGAPTARAGEARRGEMWVDSVRGGLLRRRADPAWPLALGANEVVVVRDRRAQVGSIATGSIVSSDPTVIEVGDVRTATTTCGDPVLAGTAHALADGDVTLTLLSSADRTLDRFAWSVRPVARLEVIETLYASPRPTLEVTIEEGSGTILEPHATSATGSRLNGGVAVEWSVPENDAFAVILADGVDRFEARGGQVVLSGRAPGETVLRVALGPTARDIAVRVVPRVGGTTDAGPLDGGTGSSGI